MAYANRSFVKMFDLLYVHNTYAWRQFSDRLLIGICWEESLFQNVYQTGPNTAVGFGQVEPGEFWRFKEYSLTPPPTRTTKNGSVTKVIATRPLSDTEAVVAMSVLLASLYKKLGSVDAALRGYAGYKWALDNPTIAKPSAADRLVIIAGWKNCEKALASVKPYKRPTKAEEDVIMAAMYKARRFDPAVWRAALFPPSDYA